jgi:hypothetical protein
MIGAPAVTPLMLGRSFVSIAVMAGYRALRPITVSA